MSAKTTRPASRNASSRTSSQPTRHATAPSLRDWNEIEDELVEKVRDSGRLTEKDLAFRINTKG